MRTPRSAAPVRWASAPAVVAPSPMAVNSSSSMAARSAAVRSWALKAAKMRSGVGWPDAGAGAAGEEGAWATLVMLASGCW
jgi:hypothetical protein